MATPASRANLKEYALRLGTAFTDRGNSADRAALSEYANIGTYPGAVSTIHPYTLMNIHKAHAYWNGTQHLSGKGEVIHVADFNCDPRHQEFTQGGKTTTDLTGGNFQADNTNDMHCNLVAAYAAGGFSGSSSAIDISEVLYADSKKLIKTSVYYCSAYSVMSPSVNVNNRSNSTYGTEHGTVTTPSLIFYVGDSTTH